MSVIVDIVNAVVEFHDTVTNFISETVYDLLAKWTAWFIEWWAVAWIKIKIQALIFSYKVAQNLIADLNLSAFLNQAWSSLDSKMLSMLVFFRVPEAVNIILSAGMTKFVFRFLGF